MKRLIQAVMCSIVFFSVTSVLKAAEWFDGENLIQPIPAGTWKTAENEAKGIVKKVWVSDDGKSERLQTLIFKGRGGKEELADDLMREDYLAGKKACDDMRVREHAYSTEKGYSVSTWKSVCSNKDGTIKVLGMNKVVSGKDSLYWIQKTWDAQPSGESWKMWKEYFSKIVVCDTRSSDNQCPSGFKQVE